MHVGGMALLSWTFLYPLIFSDFTDSDGSTGAQSWKAGLNSLYVSRVTLTLLLLCTEVGTLTSPFIQFSQESGEGHGVVHTNWAAPREATVLHSHPALACLF